MFKGLNTKSQSAHEALTLNLKRVDPDPLLLRVHCSVNSPNNPVARRERSTLGVSGVAWCVYTIAWSQIEQLFGNGVNVVRAFSRFFQLESCRVVGHYASAGQQDNAERIIEANCPETNTNSSHWPILASFDSMELNKSAFFTLFRSPPQSLFVRNSVLFNSSVILLVWLHLKRTW